MRDRIENAVKLSAEIGVEHFTNVSQAPQQQHTGQQEKSEERARPTLKRVSSQSAPAPHDDVDELQPPQQQQSRAPPPRLMRGSSQSRPSYQQNEEYKEGDDNAGTQIKYSRGKLPDPSPMRMAGGNDTNRGAPQLKRMLSQQKAPLRDEANSDMMPAIDSSFTAKSRSCSHSTDRSSKQAKRGDCHWSHSSYRHVAELLPSQKCLHSLVSAKFRTAYHVAIKFMDWLQHPATWSTWFTWF